jgi:hypothetical protein
MFRSSLVDVASNICQAPAAADAGRPASAALAASVPAAVVSFADNVSERSMSARPSSGRRSFLRWASSEFGALPPNRRYNANVHGRFLSGTWLP